TVIATGFNKKKKNGNGNGNGVVSGSQLRVVRKEDIVKQTSVEEKISRINSDVFEKREDVPAFTRMGIPTPEPLSENSKEEKDHLPKPNQERIRKDDSETPAFLRKIMD
ncbi:MAG: hypothetical protein IAF08_16665, partial [Rhizobacter sp.]|nr:hypothetical protein [Chlorobiales bacterium]